MNKHSQSGKRQGKTSPQPQSYCCRKKFDRVYQFEIALQEIQPTIRRRIQVPDRYSFWDLHCAITDAFGWLGYHLHQFKIVWPESGDTDIVGIPDDKGFDDRNVLPGWNLSIADHYCREIRTLNRLPPTTSPQQFLRMFGGGMIWRLFLLHAWQPEHAPALHRPLQAETFFE